jgi:phosphoribosylaminoimidazole-succinocarboxamide synthase
MPEALLTESEAEKVVDRYLAQEEQVVSTQEILDSGAVPRLRGFVVKPGKVSDSIFGGKGSYVDKATGERVEFENPPLDMSDGRPLRVMVRTERISTHDIERGDIPFKDQVLAVNHNMMRRVVAPYMGTSLMYVQGLGDNSVVIAAENLEPVPVENVMRAFMAKSSTSTSLYQAYIKGKRKFCGHVLPEGLLTNGPLPYVMDTPSTKSEDHDESLSPEQMIRRGIVSRQVYGQIRNAGLVGFGAVSNFLRQRGLILVDTKTEHGVNRNGEIVSQDELYTMDSSRFWDAEDYGEQMRRVLTGEMEELFPKSFSKEFARGMSEGEHGYTPEQRRQIAVRYIMGIQRLTGKRFEPDIRRRSERVVSGLEEVASLAVPV